MGDENSKIQKIRHVMRPSVSYTVSPAFDQFYDNYVIPSADPEIADEMVEFSRFEGTLFGAPSNTFGSSISMAVSNNIEAKVRDPDTTATQPKKIVLLNNLNFNTSYNLAADSLKWAPLRFTGSVPIVDKLDFNFNGSLDPYALDNNNQRINTFNAQNGGSLFRLTGGNISLNYSFRSTDFQGKEENQSGFNSETFQNGGRPDDLFGDATNINNGELFGDRKEGTTPTNSEWYNFSIPWDLRFAYTLTYSNSRRENTISSQSLMMSSNVELSPRWTVGVSSGYDFVGRGVTPTQLRFQRDLESWRLSFNWTPIGARNTAWYFFVGIKSSVLSDIKYDKRRVPDRGL